MARCENCLHYRLCVNIESQHLRMILAGDKAERCRSFESAADVVPKSEVASDIFKRIYRKLEYYERYRELNDIINNFFVFIEEAEKEYTEVKTLSNTDNTCIACGSIVPEGRQICLSCEESLKNYNVGKTITIGKFIPKQKTEENEDGNFS